MTSAGCAGSCTSAGRSSTSATPWRTPDGKPITVPLLFTGRERTAIKGVDIRALAEYLGHSDPGFTLRVYRHLMPSSEDKTRRAVDRSFGAVDGSVVPKLVRAGG